MAGRSEKSHVSSSPAARSAAVRVCAAAADGEPGAGGGASLPSGGKVVAGSASIGAAGPGGLTIRQSSAKAIIDWTGFSIGKGFDVSFQNGAGATLNRVTGSEASSLDGLLTATGSVYLINPNGVIIGKDGVVNVGGSFLATTLNLNDAAFLKGGDLVFSGSSSGSVVNYGRIGALGGDVALIAAKVDNQGSITAAQGDVGLISGYQVTVRDQALDDGKFVVQLGGSDTSVSNVGSITAAEAELRAQGGNVYALAGNTGTGLIQATGVSSKDGKVLLIADGGTLDVGGAIDAQGKGGSAGTIETSGETVNLGTAKINAHGGDWLLDPTNLEIDVSGANTISSSLNAGTNVTEQTTATTPSSYRNG